MTAAHLNFIDGEWCAAAKGATFEDRNPADSDDLVGTTPGGGRGIGEGGSARGLDLLDHRTRVRPGAQADVVDDDAGTLLGEQQRVFPADATAGAGHDRHLAGKPSHFRSLRRG